LLDIISKNISQTIKANVQADGNPVTIGTTPVIIYTCPAGKSCLVISYLTRVTSFGGNTFYFVNARDRRLRRARSADGEEINMIESASGGIRLAAGETISLSGNSGSNNGSAFFVFTGQELPA